MKVSVDIFGSCLSLDPIRYGIKDGKADFFVSNLLFHISPISLMMSDHISILDQFSPASTDDTDIRSISYDIRKTVFDLLGRNPSDWILIDIASIACNHIEIVYNNKVFYLSYVDENKYGQELFDILRRNNAEYRVLSGEEMRPLYQKAIQLFVEALLKIYSPDQVIFFATRSADILLRKEGCLIPLTVKRARKEDVEYAVNTFISLLPECHIIEHPDPLFGTWDHPYNISPHHYVREYYEYEYHALDVITDKWPKEEEKRRLDILKKRVTDSLNNIYQSGVYGSARKIRFLEERDSFRHIEQAQLSFMTGNWLDRVLNYYQIDSKYKVPMYSNRFIYDIREINEYISTLIEHDSTYILFGAVCDNAEKYWSNFHETKRLGMTEQLGGCESYLFIYDFESNKLFEKHDGSNAGLIYHTTYTYPYGTIYASLYSMGYVWIHEEQKAHFYSGIVINNIDYAINRRGLNCVLLDKNDGCVVDSFYVDFWDDPELIIRRY